MPIILFLLLVILIAQIGFWDTLGAVIGATAMLALCFVLAGAVVVLGGYFVLKRTRWGS